MELPRDRDGSFQPVIVAKRQRRLSSIDEIVLSSYARGLTTGDIGAHFAEIFDAHVSKDTNFRITDRVVEEMRTWMDADIPTVIDRGPARSSTFARRTSGVNRRIAARDGLLDQRVLRIEHEDTLVSAREGVARASALLSRVALVEPPHRTPADI